VSNNQLSSQWLNTIFAIEAKFSRTCKSLQCVVIFFQVGTGVTNALIKARQAASKDFDGEVENLPILSTSVAYGVYMAVSSNLR